MTDREVVVYVDLAGEPTLVGRLWCRVRTGRESATFTYDRTWLENPARFALEPALALGPGAYHTAPDRTLFGAIGDSAPDRWGRVLMRRGERQRAADAGEHPRTLREVDYLLRVDDEARQGALRFAEPGGGQFLAASEHRIPPLVGLPKLLAAADDIAGDRGGDESLRLLLAPGSSLGGARPKASVRDRDGQLTIAKFPHPSDESDVVTWEAVMLDLAEQAGIEVPARRLERVAGRPVLLLRRFDRRRQVRLPFLSAMSMLGARDNEPRSYLELCDALRQFGAEPAAGMQELWRRIVFTVLISNTDDHLRNHGFLLADPAGWRLSPAYDLNPLPAEVKPRILSTAIGFEDPTASLALALEVAEYFDLKPAFAREMAANLGRVVGSWRVAAARLGIPASEIDWMASAFEHEDLRMAQRMR